MVKRLVTGRVPSHMKTLQHRRFAAKMGGQMGSAGKGRHT
ncbi:hypothetical protein SPHINGO8AM_200101 [Sphingomonas sp. 8AM]|nr:hypothetical protein SPHINGO8AM_200101 [Sphingomonas sp. 8AM]